MDIAALELAARRFAAIGDSRSQQSLTTWRGSREGLSQAVELIEGSRDRGGSFNEPSLEWWAGSTVQWWCSRSWSVLSLSEQQELSRWVEAIIEGGQVRGAMVEGYLAVSAAVLGGRLWLENDPNWMNRWLARPPSVALKVLKESIVHWTSVDKATYSADARQALLSGLEGHLESIVGVICGGLSNATDVELALETLTEVTKWAPAALLLKEELLESLWSWMSPNGGDFREKALSSMQELLSKPGLFAPVLMGRLGELVVAATNHEDVDDEYYIERIVSLVNVFVSVHGLRVDCSQLLQVTEALIVANETVDVYNVGLVLWEGLIEQVEGEGGGQKYAESLIAAAGRMWRSIQPAINEEWLSILDTDPGSGDADTSERELLVRRSINVIGAVTELHRERLVPTIISVAADSPEGLRLLARIAGALSEAELGSVVEGAIVALEGKQGGSEMWGLMTALIPHGVFNEVDTQRRVVGGVLTTALADVSLDNPTWGGAVRFLSGLTRELKVDPALVPELAELVHGVGTWLLPSTRGAQYTIRAWTAIAGAVFIAGPTADWESRSRVASQLLAPLVGSMNDIDVLETLESIAGIAADQSVGSKRALAGALAEFLNGFMILVDQHWDEGYVLSKLLRLLAAVFAGAGVRVLGPQVVEGLVGAVLERWSGAVLAEVVRRQDSASIEVVVALLDVVKWTVTRRGESSRVVLEGALALVSAMKEMSYGSDVRGAFQSLAHGLLLEQWNVVWGRPEAGPLMEVVLDGLTAVSAGVEVWVANLDAIVELSNVRKVFERAEFASSGMRDAFLTVAMNMLLDKGIELHRDSLISMCFAIASVDWVAFYDGFIPALLAENPRVPPALSQVLGRDTDLPTFSRRLTAFANDVMFWTKSAS